MAGRSTKEPERGAQSKAFEDAARELGCDEDPARFDEALKKVARHKPATKKPAEPTDGKRRRAPSDRP